MAFLLRSILFLAPLVLTAPTLRQLGDITILAADNLISKHLSRRNLTALD